MEKISIQGARVHNLKNIDIDIPRNKLVVITGLKSIIIQVSIFSNGSRLNISLKSMPFES
jgi:excinuclease ABC subunit A